jgi:hypothetical protein
MAPFSPGGRWVAFASNGAGRFEVYVQAFPSPAANCRCRPTTGRKPRWRGDGNEIFYVQLDPKMMAARVIPI